MTQSYEETQHVFQQLRPGDRVALTHQVKVGLRAWTTTAEGDVVCAERRRHGLHFQRNPDDKVFSDVLVLQRDNGERTSVTLDEFSQLRKLSD